ncbi:MAG: FapA family protein [bacterium]
MTGQFLDEKKKILTNGSRKLGFLEVNENETKAYFTFFPPENGKVVNPEEIISSLHEEGILDIDMDIIRRTIIENQFNQRILIATGIPPTNGESAYFLYQFGAEGECPTIEVIPGQILAVKVPCGYGIPGTTVTGEKVPPLMGEDIEIIPGNNTAISPDGLKVYATGFGNVMWTGNKVEVERIFEIPNDAKENIDFQGSVLIGGNVHNGVEIKATGNVNVKGEVLPQAQIKAGKDIIARAIKGAILEAKGNVVSEEIIDGQITAQNVLLKDKGILCGGKIKANSLIEAKIIGNENNLPTTLIVDEDGKVSASSFIYPETKITIGKITIKIKKEVKEVLYYKLRDSVVQSRYKPAEIRKEQGTQILESQIYSSTIPPSVVIKATSLSEAKEIGAELLNLPPSEVDCQIGIADEDISLMRVFQLGIKGPWEEGWKKRVKEEISRARIDNIDGMFEFFNTDSGLYLSILSPKGSGKEVTLEEILMYAATKGFVNVNKDILKKAVETPSSKPIMVGPRQRLLELDGKIELEITPDYSKAYIIVTPPQVGGLPATFEEAMCALRENGVVAGIKEKVLAEAVFAQKNRPELVAEAILPVPGEPATLEYKFRADRSKVILEEDEYGRVDFKKLNLIENVRAGQVLVVKKAPGKGTPGRLINGLEIPALPGQDIKMPAGRNTEVSIGGTELIATTNGQVILAADNKVNVEDTIQIKGDINLQTGNIYFLGTVIIDGSVEDDFEVEATGDVQIKNTVGKCYISAGGSIAIGEGVKGKGAARLFAGGHIFAKYIENAKVEAKGTIQVTQEIMHSQADAGKSVLLEGKQRGSIIGGRVRAGDEIHAREIGAPAGTYTKIEVGGTPRVREQLDNLNRVYQRDVNRLETIKRDIAVLKDKKKQEKEKFPIEKEAKLQKLIREHNKLTVKLQRYTDQKEFLEVRIQESLGGKIYVSHTLFQGVTITIRNATLEIKDNYSSVSLGPKGEDEVGIYPYGITK